MFQRQPATEAGRDDALAATLRETVEAPRRAHAERLLRRAIERAELPTDCDLDLALDHMIGTLYFRVLVRRQDLDRPAIQRLADGTIAALAATRLPRSSA
ncbi:TetR-like C-terminal domain-containing protein [Streptomyces sp. NPDC020800]|uniref:TetR-like C-terminal domain-containing protein n=1 Tax=Streptomyces sp. NPDC020800 TaxID=3365092 RepID=UPI0037B11E26